MPIRKSRVSGVVTSGTTADRPSNPSIGDTFFNGTLGVQEIYTTSGWLPATGANDFNVVLTGSETSVTLDKEYFSGAYTITSALSDSSLDIYLFNTSNALAGYSNTASISATDNFNKVVIYGGASGDLLSFSYKTTFTTSTSSSDTFSAPYAVSVNNADLPNIDDTVTITGGNFDTDIEVYFEGQNSYSAQAKTVVYGSSTSIVATRPDSLLQENAPYTIRLVNPGIPETSGSNIHKLVDSITAGGAPTWNTPSGALTSPARNVSYSVQLSATDPDSGTILYSLVSGTLPTGLSLNSSTGEISGTPTAVEEQGFIVAATDSGGNSTNRSFTIGISAASGGTVSVSGGYAYHTFTSSGTFVAAESLSIDYLIVAGGGSGGVYSFDGGGYSDGLKGNDSVFNGETAIKGGGGKSWNNGNNADGGSGGGGSGNRTAGGIGTPGQGNNGGAGNGTYGGGGGGGAGGAGQSGGADTERHGDGGPGQQWLNGSYYAGGGGGGGSYNGPQTPGSGGIGGGGRGNVAATALYSQPENGAENTGGGGGGADGYYGQYHGGGGAGGYISSSANIVAGSYPVEVGAGASGVGLAGDASLADKNVLSGAGGSGIVIVRYPV